MYCPNCANPVSDHESFCGNCGYPISTAKNVPIQVQASASPPYPYAEGVAHASHVPDPKPKRKKQLLIIGIIAGVLAVFSAVILTIVFLTKLEEGNSLKGDYYLTDWLYGDDDNHIEYWTRKQYLIPYKLSFSDDGIGNVYHNDDTLYAEIAVDPNSQEGTITYQASADVHDISITVDGDKLVIYDPNYKYDSTYIYSKHGSVSIASAGNYVLTKWSCGGNDDVLESAVNDNRKLPYILVMNDDGSGKICYHNNTLFAELTVNPKEMTGTINYQDAVSDPVSYFYMISDKDTVTIYDPYYKNIFVFLKQESINLSAAKGDYVLTKWTGSYGDIFKNCVVEKVQKPIKLSMSDDGTGKIYYLETGSLYADLTIDTENLIKGKLTYQSTTDVNDVILTINGDLIAIYDPTYLLTFYYSRQGSIDLSTVEGEYVLTEGAATGYDDFLEPYSFWVNCLPSNLNVHADGNGTIYYCDSTQHAQFTVGSKDMTGQIIYNSSESSDIFMLVCDNRIAIFDNKKNTYYVYTKREASDDLDTLLNGKDKIVGSITYWVSQGEDMITTAKKENKHYPKTIELNVDGTGKVFFENGNEFLSFTFDKNNMNGKWRIGSTEGSQYVIVNGNNMTMYFTGQVVKATFDNSQN